MMKGQIILHPHGFVALIECKMNQFTIEVLLVLRPVILIQNMTFDSYTCIVSIFYNVDEYIII